MRTKPQRHQDPELLEGIRTLPCSVCLKPPPSEAHHIQTRGSGGGDYDWNVVPLCTKHHYEWHIWGGAHFCRIYPKFRGVLHFLGWRFEGARLVHHPELVGVTG